MPSYGTFSPLSSTAPEDLTRLNDMLRYLFYTIQGRVSAGNLDSEVRQTVADAVQVKNTVDSWGDLSDILHPSDLSEYIKVTDVIDTAVTSLVASGSGSMYTDESGAQVWVSSDGLSATLRNGAGFMIGSRQNTEESFEWDTVIGPDGLYLDKLVSNEIHGWTIKAATIEGAQGTFEELIAGDEDAAHLDMGRITDTLEPALYMYDSNNDKQLAITKNGMHFGENGTMVKYAIVKPSGTKSGIGIFFD